MDRSKVTKELTPILKELAALSTLGKHKEQPIAVGQLYNWLVDPHRTGEEFTYAIGPLADEVYGDRICAFPYLCITAANALAFRCPVLEGP